MSGSGAQRTWGEDDLTRRLCHALEIASRAVRLLAADGYTPTGDKAWTLRGEKIVAETGVLLLCAGPVAQTNHEVRDRLEAVARLLVPYARGDRVRARICLEPSLALDHAAAHICLTRLGFPDSGLDRLLAEALQSDSAGGHDRPPHRQLEQEWWTRVWKFPRKGPRPDVSLPRRSPLGRTMDLLAPSKNEMYAFTHALMYVTDMGTRPVRLPGSQRDTAAEADALLAACLDDLDYDLAGEVLLTWPLLQRRWSSSAALGLAVLTSVEDRTGFLPGSGISFDYLQTLDGDERSRYAVASAYHTAYVMGLLCAVTLQSPRSPPVRPAARRLHLGAASEIMNLLEADARLVFWHQYVVDLPLRARDSATELLFNVCLQRAAARRDLASIRSALWVGERFGLLELPISRQAAQLLLRSATLASLQSVDTAEH
jgi:hypothetical protein